MAITKYSIGDSIVGCKRYAFNNRGGYGGEKQENEGDEEKDGQGSRWSKHYESYSLGTTVMKMR